MLGCFRVAVMTRLVTAHPDFLVLREWSDEIPLGPSIENTVKENDIEWYITRDSWQKIWNPKAKIPPPLPWFKEYACSTTSKDGGIWGNTTFQSKHLRPKSRSRQVAGGRKVMELTRHNLHLTAMGMMLHLGWNGKWWPWLMILLYITDPIPSMDLILS